MLIIKRNIGVVTSPKSTVGAACAIALSYNPGVPGIAKFYSLLLAMAHPLFGEVRIKGLLSFRLILVKMWS